jgi:hypothetical protein
MKMNVLVGRYYDMVLELLVLFAHETIAGAGRQTTIIIPCPQTLPCSIHCGAKLTIRVI